METWVIVLIVVMCLVAAASLIGAIFLSGKNKKAAPPKPREPERRADSVHVVDGVRYTDSDAVRESGEAKVTHVHGDFILTRGKTAVAERDGELMPGKYTLLSATGDDKFNVRVGGFVKEFTHGDSLVLAEGDEITAVSGAIILR